MKAVARGTGRPSGRRTTIVRSIVSSERAIVFEGRTETRSAGASAADRPDQPGTMQRGPDTQGVRPPLAWLGQKSTRYEAVMFRPGAGRKKFEFEASL